MRWKILFTIFAGLALGACETTPDNAGSAKGAGSIAGTSPSSGGGVVSTPQVSNLAPGGIPSGSQEDQNSWPCGRFLSRRVRQLVTRLKH